MVPGRLICTLLLALAACGSDDATGPDAALGPADAGYPLPRDDIVLPVGTPTAVDIATWNIENFPKVPTAPRMVADLITSMRLDLIAVQEIEDVAAFDELVARLPDHAGELSVHTYSNGSFQKLGFIYRSDIVQLSEPKLLFSLEGYLFPRPPLQVTVTVDDGVHPAFDFIAITVHLKAGFGDEDRERRLGAVAMLEAYVADPIDGPGDDEVVILGDYNEVLTSSAGRSVMAPWLDAPQSYDVRTSDLADADEASFLPTGVILDHVVSSAGLRDEVGDGATVIPLLHAQLPGYENAVSDHLPVVLSMPVLQ